MDLELVGKRALVTGSTGGMGAAIARRLAVEGCSIVVHGRDAEAARTELAGIRAAGGSAAAVCGDLTDPEQARRVCEEAADEGPVDIVIANAGPFAELSFLGCDRRRLDRRIQWQRSFKIQHLSCYYAGGYI